MPVAAGIFVQGDTMADFEKRPQVVHVRVSADPAIVEQIASRISELLEVDGYEIIEQTAPIPSRMNMTEDRIYITLR
jgi:hypothetical protein